MQAMRAAAQAAERAAAAAQDARRAQRTSLASTRAPLAQRPWEVEAGSLPEHAAATARRQAAADAAAVNYRMAAAAAARRAAEKAAERDAERRTTSAEVQPFQGLMLPMCSSLVSPEHVGHWGTATGPWQASSLHTLVGSSSLLKHSGQLQGSGLHLSAASAKSRPICRCRPNSHCQVSRKSAPPFLIMRPHARQEGFFNYGAASQRWIAPDRRLRHARPHSAARACSNPLAEAGDTCASMGRQQGFSAAAGPAAPAAAVPGAAAPMERVRGAAAAGRVLGGVTAPLESSASQVRQQEVRAFVGRYVFLLGVAKPGACGKVPWRLSYSAFLRESPHGASQGSRSQAGSVADQAPPVAPKHRVHVCEPG